MTEIWHCHSMKAFEILSRAHYHYFQGLIQLGLIRFVYGISINTERRFITERRARASRSRDLVPGCTYEFLRKEFLLVTILYHHKQLFCLIRRVFFIKSTIE